MAVHLDDARAKCHQPSGFAELQEADRGNALPGDHIHDCWRIADEHWVLVHDQGVNAIVRQRREGAIELRWPSHGNFLKLYRQRFGGRPHGILRYRRSGNADRIEEDADTLDLRKRFFEQAQAFGGEFRYEEARSCDVAARAGDAPQLGPLRRRRPRPQ